MKGIVRALCVPDDSAGIAPLTLFSSPLLHSCHPACPDAGRERSRARTCFPGREADGAWRSRMDLLLNFVPAHMRVVPLRSPSPFTETYTCPLATNCDITHRGRTHMTTPNLANGVGKPADHLANERTFLAWIRTSISMIVFGFVVAKFGITLRQFLQVQGGNVTRESGMSLT